MNGIREKLHVGRAPGDRPADCGTPEIADDRASAIKGDRAAPPAEHRILPPSEYRAPALAGNGASTPLDERIARRGEDDVRASVYAMIPPRIVRAIRQSTALCGDAVNEIRLRRGAPASVTAGERNVVLGVCASDAEIASTLRELCERSLYAKAATICDGFIAARGGVRVGVCGRAVVRDGQIVSVAEISSLNIRIPRRIVGCADRLYEIMRSQDFRGGVLVWSPPGVGKTTMLRELGVCLSRGRDARRTAIVDSRAELAADGALADVLSLYPRAKGIEIARRTLSPQIVICDEIGTQDDAAALLEAHFAGITVCASAHASSFDGLMASPVMRSLRGHGVFATYYGLRRQLPGGYDADVRTVAPHAS